jgi:hypothetical protein
VLPLQRQTQEVDLLTIYDVLKRQDLSSCFDGKTIEIRVDGTLWIVKDLIKSIRKQRAEANQKSSPANTKNGTVKPRPNERPRKDPV